MSRIEEIQAWCAQQHPDDGEVEPPELLEDVIFLLAENDRLVRLGVEQGQADFESDQRLRKRIEELETGVAVMKMLSGAADGLQKAEIARLEAALRKGAE